MRPGGKKNIMNQLQLRGVISTRNSGQAKMSTRREKMSNSPNESASRNNSIVAPGAGRDLYNSRFQTSIDSTYREHRPKKNSNSPAMSSKKSSPRDPLKGDSLMHSYMRYSQ